MEKTIKTALIGFGMSGRIFHAPILSSLKEFELCKIYTKNKEAISIVDNIYKNTEIVIDLMDIYEDRDIELVIIATPNAMHFDLSKKALLAGKHVLVEKPFTVSSKEAEELISLSQAQKKVISVYHNRRWDSDFLTIKKIIEKNMLGNLVEYESHFDRFRSKCKENAWREENVAGAGILYDLGSHLIDQALCLFGLPNEIYADIRTQRSDAKIDDNFEILMYYDKLKVILKSGMLVKQELPHFILLGDKGSFIKYGMDIQEQDLKQGKIPKHESEWGKEPESLWGTIDTELDEVCIKGKVKSEAGDYREIYLNLFKSITKGEKLEVSANQAMNTIRIIELALESSKRREAIRF